MIVPNPIHVSMATNIWMAKMDAMIIAGSFHVIWFDFFINN